MTIQICAGVYTGLNTIPPHDLTLIGMGGSDLTVLDGVEATALINAPNLDGHTLVLGGLHFTRGGGTERQYS